MRRTLAPGAGDALRFALAVTLVCLHTGAFIWLIVEASDNVLFDIQLLQDPAGVPLVLAGLALVWLVTISSVASLTRGRAAYSAGAVPNTTTAEP